MEPEPEGYEPPDLMHPIERPPLIDWKQGMGVMFFAFCVVGVGLIGWYPANGHDLPDDYPVPPRSPVATVAMIPPPRDVPRRRGQTPVEIVEPPTRLAPTSEAEWRERQQDPKESWRETDWSAWIADNRDAQAEFRTPDGSRVDVLTKDMAFEVEYSSKWAQAIGQSLFYGSATNREPGIILLIGKAPNVQLERIYYLRCLSVCNKIGIHLETIKMQEQY